MWIPDLRFLAGMPAPSAPHALDAFWVAFLRRIPHDTHTATGNAHKGYTWIDTGTPALCALHSEGELAASLLALFARHGWSATVYRWSSGGKTAPAHPAWKITAQSSGHAGCGCTVWTEPTSLTDTRIRAHIHSPEGAPSAHAALHYAHWCQHLDAAG